MSILVVGGGSIGKRHLKNLNEITKDDLFCYKRTYDAKFENEYNCKVITTIKDIRSLSPKTILVCNPSSMHAEWIKIASEMKSNLFMEKPLIISEKQLTSVQNTWQDQNVFFIGFMLRYHPAVKKIKYLIDNKKIGDVFSARLEFGSWLPYWHPYEDYRSSYAARKDLGGGVINTITHELDLIQFFFGEPISIKTMKANVGDLQIEVEDIAESIFFYKDKLVSLHIDYLQKDYDRNIKILGSKGKLIWNWHEDKIEVILHKNVNETIEIDSFPTNQLYINEIKDFLSLVDSNQKNHSLDFHHACKNAKIMLEMHK